jgi:acid phosphatase (class A)
MIERGFLPGYLAREALPDSLALIPPPPRPGSVAHALDEERIQAQLWLQGTPRWQLAARDADLRFPNALRAFACALDAPITHEATPHLYRLLRRTLTDAGLSTYPAKYHYQRPRPFLTNDAPICTPAERELLVENYAYPSGHAAIGAAWALILAELAPDRADALLARGRAFAESRMVCNVHWYSDVVEGQFMGAATVALLRADPEFQGDFAAAREELARARVHGVARDQGCTAERAALRRAGE